MKAIKNENQTYWKIMPVRSGLLISIALCSWDLHLLQPNITRVWLCDRFQELLFSRQPSVSYFTWWPFQVKTLYFAWRMQRLGPPYNGRQNLTWNRTREEVNDVDMVWYWQVVYWYNNGMAFSGLWYNDSSEFNLNWLILLFFVFMFLDHQSISIIMYTPIKVIKLL